MKLIGKSATIQQVLRFKVRQLRRRVLAGETIPVKERRWLLTGPPGCGKTTLAKSLALQLIGDTTDYSSVEAMELPIHRNVMSLECRNGSNVVLDLVRDWYLQNPYRPMIGDIAVKFIDEIDAVGPAALNDLRTYLDEMANHRVVIACTNSAVDKLQLQLQSRFQVSYFDAVPAHEIAAHLVQTFHLGTDVAQGIAASCNGDVRAAEGDAQMHLDTLAALAEAA